MSNLKDKNKQRCKESKRWRRVLNEGDVFWSAVNSELEAEKKKKKRKKQTESNRIYLKNKRKHNLKREGITDGKKH